MITLTNGVQIPENAVQLQTTAAIDGYYVTQPLRLVQYDETLPVAAVQLTYQNQPYMPPTGAELNVRMGKPDGTTVYNPCLGMDSSGIVYFAFTQQMTIVAGTGTLTVEITGSGVKNSAPIIAEIRPNPVPEGSIESADEFLTLQEILAEAEKWGQIVQTNASNIQQVVDNLTDIQNAAENAQAAAASAEAAQQAAQEALGFRTFFSAVRPDANGNLDPSRPMVVGPAASVEIESAGDRIQSVTALGFTTQAGTGDPSPNNVRELTNGGLKLVKVVFNGTENWLQAASGPNIGYLHTDISAQAGADTHYALSTVAGFNYSFNGNGVFTSGSQLVFGKVFGAQYTVDTWKAMLAARYAAGNPVIVWYQPADEADATGLYAPIILTSGEYRATCLPLTASLCDRDSVVSWAKSGCDKVVTLDGGTSDGFVYADAGASGNLRRMRVTIPGVLDYEKGGFGFSDWVNYKVRYASTEESFYCTVDGVFLFLAAESLAAAKQILSQRPLTMWLRSANYTPATDIPVSLETHQQAVVVLDGTENIVATTISSGKRFVVNVGSIPNVPSSPGSVGDILCSHYKPVSRDTTNAGTHGISFKTPNQSGFYIVDDRYTGDADATNFKAYLAEQYAAGTPVTIVYQLAAPITYAHPAVELEAATGGQLTYTVTGQSGGTVSVALKPFQDGGNAKTADSAANAQNAVNAQTANNSQQLGGLTLSALQNRLVPVGYIFSWAPASGGPDLSTAQKVAAYFGFGTWRAYGNGQVLVGVDSNQTEFASVGQTGGEKTNTLTVQQIPEHQHGMKWSNEGGAGSGNGVLIRDANSGGPWPYTYFTGNAGGGQPHNNLQPYITVYRWQRVK